MSINETLRFRSNGARGNSKKLKTKTEKKISVFVFDACFLRCFLIYFYSIRLNLNMPISSKVINFLNKAKVKYEQIEHKKVFTAYDKAATLKVKPNVIGKSLALKADRDLAIVLVPGNKKLDLMKIKKAVNVWRKKQSLKLIKKVDFISETIIKNKFKGIKIGAIPPFGEIWKLPVFVDRGLMKEKNIFVNSGIYEISFKISPKVFEKLEAILGNFSKSKK